MKLLVPFPIGDRFKEIGTKVLGKDNVIWYPDSGEADALLIRDNDYPKDKNFKFIQTVSAGTDHIDINKIPANTLVASNAGAYSISVAEHAFALLLERTKRISIFENETKNGIYRPHSTKLLYGRTVGIIGYGGIGSRVAYIAKALGMKVVTVGRGHRDQNSDEFLGLDKLDKLLVQSDFIVISIPLTIQTEDMLTERNLKLLKKDCIIVNVARPELVKKSDLLQFLDSHGDVTYMTDVWWNEPNLDDSNRKNILVTPHVAGGLSGEIMEVAYLRAFENIKRFMQGEIPLNLVRKDESLYLNRKKIGI
jgi:Lactate dehydrogenase and related dehydrogenases